jgi:hypothetical protein
MNPRISPSIMSIKHKGLFEDIYTILVGFGASEKDRRAFIDCFTNPGNYTPYEWRFCGVFGFGGKFRYGDYLGQLCPFYVDYYYENKCAKLDEQQRIARKLIKDCYDKYVAEVK